MKTRILCATIISLLIVSMLVTGCAVTSNVNLAGRINGTPIPYAAWMDSYRAHYNNFQVLNNRVPDKDEIERIKKETWVNVAKHVILTGYFKKYGITVSQGEVMDTLKTNIPSYILTSPKFMTKGVFDHGIYLQSLQYDTPENLVPLRKHYQEYLIPIMKLQNYLIEKELLTPNERKLCTRILQSQAEIEFTILDTGNISPIIGNEEIDLYYQANQKRFKYEPTYKLGFTKVTVAPSSEDVITTAALADSIHGLLLTGGNPEQLTDGKVIGSEKIIVKNSGFLRNNSLDPSLYSILSALAPGEYSEPIADKEGLIIYQLEERTKSLTSFNTILLPYLPSAETIAKANPFAAMVSKLSLTTGLKEACQETDLYYEETSVLKPEDNWLGDSTVEQSILTQVRERLAGTVLEPVYSSTQRAWIVAEVKFNQLNTIRKISEVREQILNELTTQRRQEMAMSLATQIIKGQAAKPSHAVVERVSLHNNASFMGSPMDNHFFNILHRHYLSEPQKPIVNGNLILIPKVVSTSLDRNFSVSSVEVKKVFTANLPENWFDQWMIKKVETAELAIYIK